MSKQKIYIVGITEDATEIPKKIIRKLQEKHKENPLVFSGGKRHHQIVKPFLPDNYTWIDITSPIHETLKKYHSLPHILIFASGDPLFYGIAETMIREFPEAEIFIEPTFNSLQTLASRIKIPYGQMKTISLTGRDWKNLDIALIEREKLIGILTDNQKNPKSIATRMKEFGYNNYSFNIGVNLGSPNEEIFTNLSIDEVLKTDSFGKPNCLILKAQEQKSKFFGIPEQLFKGLDGRPNMITKMPVRLLDLSLLDLANKATLWDIGSCTGSISIEAKLQFPHLEVVAIEKRVECEEIIRENARRFGTPGINLVISDFMTADMSVFPAPDSVFLGGYSGDLSGVLTKLQKYVLPSTTLVFNSVNQKSKEAFIAAAEQFHLSICSKTAIKVDEHHPITIFKAQWER